MRVCRPIEDCAKGGGIGVEIEECSPPAEATECPAAEAALRSTTEKSQQQSLPPPITAVKATGLLDRMFFVVYLFFLFIHTFFVFIHTKSHEMNFNLFLPKVF
jgi:hypothetical protein